MCLAVSQTFKIEKAFDTNDLGCAEAVLTAIRPLLLDLGLIAKTTQSIRLSGDTKDSDTYYLIAKPPKKVADAPLVE